MSTRILYITGSGRSGTTLLGHVLGQMKGYCFIGEGMYGGAGLAARRCGCGQPLRGCEFWAMVRRHAGGGSPGDDHEFFGLGRLTRWRHLPAALGPRGARRLAARFGSHWTSCQRLYASIAAASDAEVIVDSSKSVPYGRALALMPEHDVRVVHLVRDARAVAYSWMRLKPAADRFDAPHMAQRGRFQAAANWSIANLGAELFLRRGAARYIRLRYEDVVARPRESIERIVAMTSRAPAAPPLLDDRTLMLGATHSVWGNPDRLRTGRVELREDDQWRTDMRAPDRRLVTGLTWPLLARYGYLGSPRAPGPPSRTAARSPRAP